MKTILSLLFSLVIFLSSCTEYNNVTNHPQQNTNKQKPLSNNIASSRNTSKKIEQIISNSLEVKSDEWPTQIYDPTFGKIELEQNSITPQALCGEKVTYGWSTDHFEPKDELSPIL